MCSYWDCFRDWKIGDWQVWCQPPHKHLMPRTRRGYCWIKYYVINVFVPLRQAVVWRARPSSWWSSSPVAHATHTLRWFDIYIHCPVAVYMYIYHHHKKIKIKNWNSSYRISPLPTTKYRLSISIYHISLPRRTFLRNRPSVTYANKFA